MKCVDCNRKLSLGPTNQCHECWVEEQEANADAELEEISPRCTCVKVCTCFLEGENV